MQSATVKFTKSDLSRYPFLKENAEYVEKLDLRIEDLAAPEFVNVLQRAQERVEESILYAVIDRNTRNEEVEILSFPVAVMLVIATGNSFIRKRYALAEAKQSYGDLRNEPKERIVAVAQNFGWKLEPNADPRVPYEFALQFTDYLRNTVHLREKKWKLVNRILSDGKVYVARNEACRLLSEEVRRYIEQRLDTKELPNLPQTMKEMAEKIKQLSLDKLGKTEVEGFPKAVSQSAFPPCVASLYETFKSGRHLSHIGRFTLTSFLINIGMPSEEVVELFKNISDFNEKMTRYQVEHIAGERGSRTRYTTPMCDTLKTHGVCANPDELCRNIRHPLGYYRRRLSYSESKKTNLKSS